MDGAVALVEAAGGGPGGGEEDGDMGSEGLVSVPLGGCQVVVVGIGDGAADERWQEGRQGAMGWRFR